MLFNSIDFIIFLPLVFTIYWALHSHLKTQNTFVVMASLVFYGWWDWRFLFLLLISSIVDYYISLKIQYSSAARTRRNLLLISIIVNLGLLGFFKYYNFFIDSFVTAFTFFGHPIDGYRLNIVLPVGISFYTFQTLSYTIDVYRKRLPATNDFVAFLAYVSFFPQLVAGPIERATHLLPQFQQQRTFDTKLAVDGMRQILWGFFKKLVIADNCATLVNMIFADYETLPGSMLVAGAILFAFQIYGDFSGYSDIAVGTSRLFGFELMQNFSYPYFARDVAEFWRRWHISLTTWFRDYVYIPLGGSHVTGALAIRNVFVVFLLSGLWHGANWTYITWGLLNVLYFLPLMLTARNRVHTEIVARDRMLPGVKDVMLIFLTFCQIVFAWIFFRVTSVEHAIRYLSRIFSIQFFNVPELSLLRSVLIVFLLISIFVFVEWIGRRDRFALQRLDSIRRPWSWMIYSLIVFAIGMFMQSGETPFIYFQF